MSDHSEPSPKVTVLMAVHNGEEFLCESIDSILSQSFEDFELLIVEDGSTDNSLEVIQNYTDKRVRILKNDANIGLTRSLNRGILEATGEYIARLDVDDISLSERLSKQVEYLNSHENIALVACWNTEFKTISEQIPKRNLPTTYIEILWTLFFETPFAHSSVMWRKNIVSSRVGLYDEALFYSQDYDYWARISDVLETYSIPEYLVQKRQHSSSMSDTYGPLVLEGYDIRKKRMVSFAKAHQLEFINSKSLDEFTKLLFGYSYTDRIYEDTSIDQYQKWDKNNVRDITHKLLNLHQEFAQSQRVASRYSSEHLTSLKQNIANRMVTIGSFKLRNFDVSCVSLFLLAIKLSPNPKVFYKILIAVCKGIASRIRKYRF